MSPVLVVLPLFLVRLNFCVLNSVLFTFLVAPSLLFTVLQSERDFGVIFYCSCSKADKHRCDSFSNADMQNMYSFARFAQNFFWVWSYMVALFNENSFSATIVSEFVQEKYSPFFAR